MKKNILRFLLVAFSLILVLASCESIPVKPEDITIPNEHDKTEPREDQMGVRVTADLPAVVPSAFTDGSTGAALVSRIPNAGSIISPDTRLVVLKGDFFDGEGAITSNEMMEYTRTYLRGGYLCIERPTRREVTNIGLSLTACITAIVQEDLKRNFGFDEDASYTAAENSQAVERVRVRMDNIGGIATRAGNSDPKQVLAELLILGNTACFFQQPMEAEARAVLEKQDDEGHATDAETIIAVIYRTPYNSGRLADAAAQWLNEVEKTKKTADGKGAINEIMAASEQFTFSGPVDWTDEDGNLMNYKDRVMITVRSWGVHDMAADKDYYYLKQDVSLLMGSGSPIYFPLDENTWYKATNYPHLNRWFGSFLSRYENSMELSGSGSIQLEAASPAAGGSSSRTTVSVGSPSSQPTVGQSLEYSGGYGKEMPELASKDGSGLSWGYLNSHSFEVGTAASSQDLSVGFSTEGTKVTWSYKGELPSFSIKESGDKRYYSHGQPAPALVKDCVLSTETCWSVSNPKDRYTVNIESTPQTAALLFMASKSNTQNPTYTHYTTTGATEHYSRQLLIPNRVAQDWRMFIVIDEWKNQPIPNAHGQLLEKIRENFPDTYAPRLNVADKTADSYDAISCIIQYSKEQFTQKLDLLQDIAKNLGISKFSIYWRYEDKGLDTTDPFVVEVPGHDTPAAQAVWCEDNTTLYFINAASLKAGSRWDGHTVTRVWKDKQVVSSPKTDLPEWALDADVRSRATRVVIDKSFEGVRPQSCAYWFYSFDKLGTVQDLEYMITSEVTTLESMFSNCTSLTTLFLDGFDVNKVSRTQRMFSECTSLTTIYCNYNWHIENSSWMFYGCTNLLGASAYNSEKTDGAMANPENGYFTWPVNTNFLVLNENSRNRITLKRYEGQTVNVRYDRTLSAKSGEDGKPVPRPYTVCLPYDFDLSGAVKGNQVAIYTLAAVENGRFVFVRLDVSMLNAGTPYLVMVNSGSISLNANRVTITATTPKSSIVYDSLAAWKQGSGTEVGEWVGNFDYLSNTEASGSHAYALQPADQLWTGFDTRETGWIPAFRAFLTSSSIEKKSYPSVFEE